MKDISETKYVSEKLRTDSQLIQGFCEKVHKNILPYSFNYVDYHRA